MKIEIHQERTPMTARVGRAVSWRATRATDSQTIWIDFNDAQNELTMFITPEQAKTLGADLSRCGMEALRIREVLAALSELNDAQKEGA